MRYKHGLSVNIFTLVSLFSGLASFFTNPYGDEIRIQSSDTSLFEQADLEWFAFCQDFYVATSLKHKRDTTKPSIVANRIGSAILLYPPLRPLKIDPTFLNGGSL